MTIMKWTKDRPFWECPDEIDVAMLADVMVALYRFLPEDESIPIFTQCCEPERSEAVKICAVKACLTLVVDVRVTRVLFLVDPGSDSDRLRSLGSSLGNVRSHH